VPFSFISLALGLGFVLVWLLVGSMLLRSGQGAARDDRETESAKPQRKRAA
jgi:hypothetical protein